MPTVEEVIQNNARLREENDQLRAEVERLQELNERTHEISRERVSRERGKHKPKERSGFVFASKCAPYNDRFNPNCNAIKAWCVTLETSVDANTRLDDVQECIAGALTTVLDRLNISYYETDGMFYDIHGKELYDKMTEICNMIDDETEPCFCYRATYEQDTRTRLWHVRLFLTKPLPRLDLY